jgi:hypothetical protein
LRIKGKIVVLVNDDKASQRVKCLEAGFQPIAKAFPPFTGLVTFPI